MEFTEQQTELLKKQVDKRPEYIKMGEKTTVCLLTVKNGFEIVGTSACVDPADFDEATGRFYALTDAIGKLAEYEAFYRQQQGIK